MKKIYYGNIIAAAAFVLWIVSWGSLSTFGIFLKPIIEETGWERADLSLAYSMLTLFQAIIALGMGKLTDKLGPRLIVTVFGSFIAISFLLLAQTSYLWQFQAIYAVIGSIGFSTATIPIMTTIARWFTQRRGRVTGIVQSGMGIGGLIFAPLTGWMILAYNWRTAYLFLGLITLPLIITAGLLLKRDPGDAVQSQDTKAASGKDNIDCSPQIAGLCLKEALQTKQ